MGFLSATWEKQAGFANFGRLLNRAFKASPKYYDPLARKEVGSFLAKLKDMGDSASRWTAKHGPEAAGRFNTMQFERLLRGANPPEGFIEQAMRATGGDKAKAFRLARKGVMGTVRKMTDDLLRNAGS